MAEENDEYPIFWTVRVRKYKHFIIWTFGTKSIKDYLGRAKRIWYLSPMRAAKVQASLRIRAVSPEPSLLAQTSSESRGTFRQKTRSLAPLNGWTCAVKVCHDGMLEDTNSLGAAHISFYLFDAKYYDRKHLRLTIISYFYRVRHQ